MQEAAGIARTSGIPEILAYRKDDYQWNVLVADKEKTRRKYKTAVVDDILLLYVKGEQAK